MKQTQANFQGIRKPVYSVSGEMLYVSNDTPANRLWSLLERTILPPRSRDIVMNKFPAKHIWDALALGQIFLRPDFDVKQKASCLRFYFDGAGIRNLLATAGRTGSNWTMLGIAIASDLANGGPGTYEYVGPWTPSGGIRYTKLDWRTPARAFPDYMTELINDPFYFHTHLPYYRIRCAQLKNMKTVIVVRSILESLESHYFKSAGNPRWPELGLDDWDKFSWDRHLDEILEFYNSWGEAARSRVKCLIFKYHELKADPVGTHKAMTDFWGLNIPEECIEEAFKRNSKKAMEEKIPKEEHDTNHVVSFRTERGVIPEHIKNHILERLNRELIYDFGYDYSEKHDWGHNYD